MSYKDLYFGASESEICLLIHGAVFLGHWVEAMHQNHLPYSYGQTLTSNIGPRKKRATLSLLVGKYLKSGGKIKSYNF